MGHEYSTFKVFINLLICGKTIFEADRFAISILFLVMRKVLR